MESCLRQCWKEISRGQIVKGLEYITKVLAIVCIASEYREQVLPDTASLFSPNDPHSRLTFSGEKCCRERKPFINGSPRRSFPEPGQPITLHSSASPIRVDNTLYSFWGRGSLASAIDLKQNMLPESCLENTHILSPTFSSSFHSFSVFFLFWKCTFRKRTEYLPHWKLDIGMMWNT